MKTLRETNRAVDTARTFYRNYIQQFCDQNGTRQSVSVRLGRGHDYIKKILDRDNFMALRRLANNLADTEASTLIKKKRDGV